MIKRCRAIYEASFTCAQNYDALTDGIFRLLYALQFHTKRKSDVFACLNTVPSSYTSIKWNIYIRIYNISCMVEIKHIQRSSIIKRLISRLFRLAMRDTSFLNYGPTAFSDTVEKWFCVSFDENYMLKINNTNNDKLDGMKCNYTVQCKLRYIGLYHIIVMLMSSVIWQGRNSLGLSDQNIYSADE